MVAVLAAAFSSSGSSTGGSCRAAIQRGMGQLTAIADHPSHSLISLLLSSKKTRLTRVSHRAPTRLLPMRVSSVEKAGAALVALSNYGGGMVQGDSSDLNVIVGQNATLGLVTQGPSRIYGSRQRHFNHPNNSTNNNTCRSTMTVTVGTGGCLVLAPDPCVTFSKSSLVVSQKILLEPGASVVWIDWFGAGRIANGERWDLTRLSSRSAFFHDGDPVPFLVEAVSLDRRRMPNDQYDPFGFGTSHTHDNDDENDKHDPLCCNAFATVIMHGPAVDAVAAQCEELGRSLAAKWTRIRRGNSSTSINSTNDDMDEENEEHGELHRALSGRVLMGFSKVENANENGDASYVARLAANSNEDIYRVLHFCLKPLQTMFGYEFYRDHIQASTSSLPVRRHFKTPKHSPLDANDDAPPPWPAPDASLLAPTTTSAPPATTNRAFWRACMLADSGLPTGGFAHSAGLEAAAQLGLFHSQDSVGPYILTATRSATQLQTPFCTLGHELVMTMLSANDLGPIAAVDEAHLAWLELDRCAHAFLVSNGPGCRASLSQGEGLLRVSIPWLIHQTKNNRQAKDEGNGILDGSVEALLTRIQSSITQSDDAVKRGHVGPLLGVVGGLLGLSRDDACRVLGYCAARDMISAAVRLNLIGPLASVAILDQAWDAVQDGLDTALAASLEAAVLAMADDSNDPLAGLVNAAGCSPVADAVHPSHDLLSVRLFRS